MLFSGRMMWQTGCKKLPLSLINSRTNTLIVKQRVLLPGNGVVLQYNSRNTTKKYYQGTSLKASLLLYVRGSWQGLQSSTGRGCLWESMETLLHLQELISPFSRSVRMDIICGLPLCFKGKPPAGVCLCLEVPR